MFDLPHIWKGTRYEAWLVLPFWDHKELVFIEVKWWFSKHFIAGFKMQNRTFSLLQTLEGAESVFPDQSVAQHFKSHRLMQRQAFNLSPACQLAQKCHIICYERGIINRKSRGREQFTDIFYDQSLFLSSSFFLQLHHSRLSSCRKNHHQTNQVQKRSEIRFL